LGDHNRRAEIRNRKPLDVAEDEIGAGTGKGGKPSIFLVGSLRSCAPLEAGALWQVAGAGLSIGVRGACLACDENFAAVANDLDR
jgi:hypothetical protein